MKKIFYEMKLLNRSIPGFLFGLMVVSIVMMNLLANKSIDTHSDIIAADCGIIFSWVTFFVMDIVVKRYGLKAGNYLTIMGLLVNLFIALMLLVASYIPGFWGESYNYPDPNINNALDSTIRGTWYVLLGSSVAFLVSSILNNILNHFIGSKTDKNDYKGFVLRSFVSTFIAQFVDNMLFALIVCMNFFGWNFIQCLTCAIIGAVLELLFEILLSPLAYKWVKKLEKDNVGLDYINYINQKDGEVDESTN